MPHNHLESPELQSFDYTALNAETKIFVQEKTTEIKHLIRRSAQDIINIGHRLIEVKEQLGHGSFRRWLGAEFIWSIPAANKFMQVAQKFKSINFIHLDMAASALYLLAAPSTPEEARQEAIERAAQGEAITYAIAKQIRFHHTIDVEAETVANDQETLDPAQAPLDQEALSQPEIVDEPLPLTTEAEIGTHATADAEPQPTPEPSPVSRELEDSAQTKLAPVSQFQVSGGQRPAIGDGQRPAIGHRIRILRRQHGEDNWAGKTARIWQITSDGWLRVDVEGRPGVKFTPKPEWVEYMPEVTPEQQNEQPEPALNEGWADEAPPQFQAGDRLQVTNLGKSNQQWTGEVAEVVEAAEDCIKVIVEIRPAV